MAVLCDAKIAKNNMFGKSPPFQYFLSRNTLAVQEWGMVCKAYTMTANDALG